MTNTPIDLPSITAKIYEIYKDQIEVVAVYLFGSAIKGGFNRYSDVDLAVLYKIDRVPDHQTRLSILMRLLNYLDCDIDLIILNTVPCILKTQVLKTGKLIVNNNPPALHRFILQTWGEYFDLKRVRYPIEQSLKDVSIYG